MTCVTIVAEVISQHSNFCMQSWLLIESISKLVKNKVVFIFSVDLSSLFILNGNFGEYLDNI